jgi:Ni/Fe-hydrogenase subunit HybB-like protein
MKIGSISAKPGIGALFSSGFLGFMWLLEMAVGVIIPILLMAKKSSRKNLNKIFVANIMVIVGVLLNRLNVGVFGVSDYANRVGSDYFPSFMELLLTAGMIAFAILGFKVCAKYLNLFPDTHH